MREVIGPFRVLGRGLADTCMSVSLLAMLGVLACAVAPASSLGASCPAGTVSAAGYASYLPDCRAYELVTPPYKGGGEILFGGPAAFSPDGTRAVIGIGGSFAGAENLWWHGNRNPTIDAYQLTRGPEGWSAETITPPASVFPHGVLMAEAADLSGPSLWGAATNGLQLNESIFMRASSAQFALVGPGSAPAVRDQNLPSVTSQLSFAGASANLSHAIFSLKAFTEIERTGAGGHDNLWPGDTTRGEAESLYEYAYSGVPLQEPTLVGVANEGRLASNAEAQLLSDCGTILGSTSSVFNAESRDGSTTYFTAKHEAPGVQCATPTADEVYARVDAETTVAISEPSTQDCASCDTATADRRPATFVGAAASGGQVYFMTEQALLPGAAGNELYEYDVNAPRATVEKPAGRIRLVSGGPESGEVQGVVRISADGSHVYFVARGVLTGANGEGKLPTAGADNLYVDEPSGGVGTARHLVFVATLMTPEEEATVAAEEAEEQPLVASAGEKAAVAAFEQALAGGAGFPEAFELALAAERQAESLALGTLGPTGTLAADHAVWNSVDERPAQTTPSGSKLIFVSSAHLALGDTSTVPQLFEYDAVAERVTWLSVTQAPDLHGEEDGKTFTRSAAIPSQSYLLQARPTQSAFGLAISDDGETVAFTSGARLVPQVADAGTPNVFENRGGVVSLVSDGKDTARGAGEPVVRLAGLDSAGTDVFFTTADSLVPEAAAAQVGLYDARENGGFPARPQATGCQGDACRGPLAPAGSTPTPVTETSAGESVKPVTKSQTLRKPSRAARRSAALRLCRRLKQKRRRRCEAAVRKRLGTQARRGRSSTNARAKSTRERRP